eukprot:maker-scaffold347_size200506-snap-gene-0.20 protein:Tk02312 transcript:maker-scaffold347_size200506-snap-gene-0.20-mRNA-1 annotation:"giwi protein"
MEDEEATRARLGPRRARGFAVCVIAGRYEVASGREQSGKTVEDAAVETADESPAVGRGRAPPAGRSVPTQPGPPPTVGRGRSALPPGAPRSAPPPVGRGGVPAARGRAAFRQTESPAAAPLTVSGLSLNSEDAVVSSLEADVSNPGPSKAGSNGSQSMGRGATRGTRSGTEIIRTRPHTLESKQGQAGNSVQLLANYFPITRAPDWKIFQYRVDTVPEEDHIGSKKRMVRVFEREFGTFIFDGTMLFSMHKLSPDGSPLTRTTEHPHTQTVVEITFSFTNEVEPTTVQFLHLLNIIMNTCLESKKLGYQRVGRDYFDPKAREIYAKFNVEMWPGYRTSIRQHESEILLCTELCTKLMRTDTVLDQMMKRCRGGPDKNAILKALLGKIVLTKFNNKTYRVDDVDFDNNPGMEFEMRNGDKKTIANYYRERYGIVIRDLKQPLLVSMPKDRDRRRFGETPTPVKLVPELCHMTGVPEEFATDLQFKKVNSYTRQDPQKRVETLQKFAARFHQDQSSDPVLSKWGLQFQQALVPIKGRTLLPELIECEKNTLSYSVDNADWNQGLRNLRVINPKSCANWSVIFVEEGKDLARKFVDCLKKVSVGLGWNLPSPREIVGVNGRKSTELYAAIQASAAKKPSMILVFIPNQEEMYSGVKKILCVNNAIPSQVVTINLLKRLEKGMMSVATKVSLQMATKLGCEPWRVKIPVSGTMVIGYDSYHDTTNKANTVGAVVSTINKELSRFTSFIALHKNGEELHSHMKLAITKALRKYHEENGTYPNRIVIYRDGVGDGNIDYHEISMIKSVFAQMQIEPRLAYLVVSKRVNSRFFSKSPRIGNPNSGTVIDDVVTLPERYDFFLISQSVRQGTVNPTNYNVIEDTSGFRPDHLQQLTYKLTHMYYNWAGTVRVPSVCQYAHKLAKLVGEALHTTPNAGLDHLLYYL